MQPINRTAAAAALRSLSGGHCFIHFEFTRGGFVRNLAADVEEALIRGDGPYRIGIRCKANGWVVMEGLTHMEIREGEPLFFGTLESDQRLAQALQISREVFAP